ncbi:MAG: hypothetical protein LC730_02995, partial [Acidobacteria bacterium]|nr:hypothetical protein [Acidobacteriota bacterium]
MDTLVKSYRNDKPDLGKYIIIESLYRKLNGSLEGLDEKIGRERMLADALPVPVASPAPVAAPENEKADSLARAQPTKRIPKTVPVQRETIAVEKPAEPQIETEKAQVRAEPSATRAIQTESPKVETTISGESNEKTPPAKATSASRPEEHQESPKSDGLMSPAVSSPRPNEKKLDPSIDTPPKLADNKEIEKKVEIDEPLPIEGKPPNPEPKIKSDPPDKSVEKAVDENARAMKLSSAEAPSPRYEVVTENLAPPSSPKVTPRSSADNKLAHKPLFDPVIISVPASSDPARKLVTAKSVDPKSGNLEEEDQANRRVRVVENQAVNVDGPATCSIKVSLESVSILADGGMIGLLVGTDDEAVNISATSSSPRDVEVTKE